jgi:hypothetical protein
MRSRLLPDAGLAAVTIARFFGRVCRLRTTPVDYSVRQEPRATASIVSTALMVTGVSAVGQEDGSASSDQERRELRGRSGAQWLGAGPEALTYALQLTAAMSAAVVLAMAVAGAVSCNLGAVAIACTFSQPLSRPSALPAPRVAH